MWRAALFVSLSLVAGCKKQPESCKKIEACCAALAADAKAGALGKFVGEAYDKVCEPAPTTDDTCQMYTSTIPRGFAEAQTPANNDTPPREPAACADLHKLP